MTAIHAQTQAEASAYISLATSECTDSGSTVDETISYSEDGNEWVAHHDLKCLDCGLEWHFDVTVDPEPDRVDGAPEQYRYDPEPSRLIDAGQWYLMFVGGLAMAREVQERQGPNGPFDLLELERMIDGFDSGRAALDEVLKFIPAGQDRVPDSAVWTDQGRWAYGEESAQFTRDRLEDMRGQMAAANDIYLEHYRRIGGE
jgi:hypothetical protein